MKLEEVSGKILLWKWSWAWRQEEIFLFYTLLLLLYYIFKKSKIGGGERERGKRQINSLKIFSDRKLYIKRVREIAQWIKTFAIKLDDLS